MLRTTFYGSGWQEIPLHELAQLAETARLDGLVLDETLVRQHGSDLGSRLKIAALRADYSDAASFAETAALAARLGVRKIILRAKLDGPPAEIDLAPWRDMGECAAGQGQTIAVDFGSSVEFDARTMSKFIKDIAHARVRLCFDLGAYASHHPFSHWEVALQRVVVELDVLWLSDATGTPGDKTRPPLGEGAIDYLRVNEIVRPLALDTWAVIDFDRRRRGVGTVVQQCASLLSESILHLERCGWFDP